MSEKKTTQIAVHLSDTRKIQIMRFADRKGVSASEYVHMVIEKHFKEIDDENRLIRSLLEVDSSMSSEITGDLV